MTDKLIIIISLLLFLIVGIFTRQKERETIGEYSINRNRLLWFPIAAGISMTFAGGASLLNMASLGYTYSWYTLFDPGAVLGGIIIVLFFIKVYREDMGVTISNLLSKSNQFLSILIGIITSTVFILIVAAQFVALSKLLIPYFPSINPLLLTTILSTMVFSYVYWGGFSSVTKTDILQLVFIAFFLVLPTIFFLLFKNSSFSINTNENYTFSQMPINMIILISVPLLFIPLSQDINIRVKSAINKKHAILGLLIGVCFYSTIIIVSTTIGISLARGGIVLNDPETAYSTFFKLHFNTLGLFAILAAIAAIVSSMDSYALNGITSVSQDILSNIKPFKYKHPKKLISISAFIVFVISLSIALFFNQILALILTSLLIYISMLLPIAIGKFLKLSDKLITLGSLVIISVILIMELGQWSIGNKAIIYPLFGMGLFLIMFLFIKIIDRK